MLDKIVSYIVLGALFLFPIVIVPTTWISQPGLKTSLLGLMMLFTIPLFLVAMWRRGSVLIPQSAVWAMGAIVPFGYALSTIFAPEQAKALLGYAFNTDSLVIVSLSFVAGFLVTLAIANGFITREHTQKIVAFATVALGVLFSVQVLAYAGVLPKAFSLGGMLSVSSWVTVAVVLGFGVVTMLALQRTCPQWRIAVLMSINLVMMVIFANILVVWTLLMVIAAFMILETMYRSGFKLSWSRAYTLPLVVLLFAVPMLLDSYVWGGRAVAYIQQVTKVSFIDVRPSWGGTLTVGKEVLLGDSTKMLFGSGAGSFDTQWRIHRPVEVNNSEYWSTSFGTAIGFIPTSVITGGFVVFIGWALFLLTLAWYAFKFRSYTGYSALFMWIAAGVLPFDIVALVIAFVAAGLFVGDLATKERVRSYKFNLRGEGVSYSFVSALIIFALITFAGVGIVIQRVVADVFMQRAALALVEGNSNGAEQMLLRAKPFADKVMIEQGYTQVAIAQFRKLLDDNAQASTTPDQATVTAALSNILTHARSAIALDPTNPTNYIGLGTIAEQLIPLKIAGSFETAVGAYEQAALLDAKNPELQVQLARLYIGHDDIEKAEKALKSALTLKGNYVPALYDYGVLKLSQGDAKTAIDALLGAVQLTPNYANALYYLAVALTQENRFADALVAMQKVQELNPGNIEVTKIVQALQQRVAEMAATSATSTRKTGAGTE